MQKLFVKTRCIPRSLTDKDRDELVRDYGTVLRESAVLIAFSGVLFGFLFNVAVNIPTNFSEINQISLLTALFSITIAISLFIMPVIYHHIQYPYTDVEKFKRRSHRFIVFGIGPAIITLYLGLEVALSVVLGDLAFFIAAAPFVAVYALFKARKW